jgi:hypothetical protein
LFAHVDDLRAADTEVLDPQLVDGAFWWTRSFSTANVPIDDVAETLK